MGFLDKFFGKTNEKKELKFSELDSWINDELREYQNRILGEAKPVAQEIIACKLDLRETIRELDKPVDDRVYPKVKGIVKTSKPKYISSMITILDSLSLDEEPDYESIIGFQKRFSESLERIGKATLTDGRYLPMAYSSTMESIKKEIKKLIDYGKKLDEKLESIEKIKALEAVRDGKTLYETLNTKKEAAGSDLTSVSNELDGLNKQLVSTKSEHDKLRRDDQLSDTRKTLEETMRSRKSIENSVYQKLASINKPLRRYERIVSLEKKLTNEEQKRIKGYIDEPVEEFISQGNLEQVLAGMEQALSEGKISDKNPEKLHRLVKDIVGTLTDSLKEEYSSLLEKEKQLEKDIEISPLTAKNEELGSRIKQLEDKISSKNKELKAVDKRNKELIGEVSAVRKQVGDGLSELGISATF